MRILDAVGRRLGRSERPRGTDFYDLAQREPRVPEAELAVASAVLTGAGPIAERALRQLQQTPACNRLRPDDGSYEMRIVTYDNLTIRGVPRDGWRSAWIPVETTHGRRLAIEVEIPEAGIVGLFGRTDDGAAWPKTWQVANTVLDRVRADGPWIRLPTPGELTAERARAAEAIGNWLGDLDLLRGRRGTIHASPPASEAELDAFAMRESFAPPDAYLDLLRVADGVQIGSIDILGSRDAYHLDLPGPDRLVIAPPNEDGALVLDESGAVVWIDIDDVAGTGVIRSRDLRTWLAARLGRRKKGGERPGS